MSEEIRTRITIIEQQVLRQAAPLPRTFDVYDPALDTLKHALARGSVNNAMDQARVIAGRNEAAGYVAYELVKFGALEAGRTYDAESAAGRAANLRQKLLKGG